MHWQNFEYVSTLLYKDKMLACMMQLTMQSWKTLSLGTLPMSFKYIPDIQQFSSIGEFPQALKTVDIKRLKLKLKKILQAYIQHIVFK